MNKNTQVTNTTVNVNRSVNVQSRGGYGTPYRVNHGDVDVYRGRRGAAVVGEEGAAAIGRRGAVVAGEGGVTAVGRYGGVYHGHTYEDNEAWKIAAGVVTGIAIGTMLATPPPAATTVVVSGSTYYHHDDVYYSRVYSSGQVVYQVVGPPAGVIITTLPTHCVKVIMGGVMHHYCDSVYYRPMATGFQVVYF